MKWTILWTDFLVYILLGMLLMFVVQAIRTPHLRTQLRVVIYRPLNLIAMMVLGAYLVIGVLDCFHFQPVANGDRVSHSSQLVSLLDMAVAPLPELSEKTYSAPFATHGFVKETLVDQQGNITRGYPRLEVGGSHLQDPSTKAQDIRQRLTLSSIYVLIMWLALSIICLFIASRFSEDDLETTFVNALTGKAVFPWRTFLIMVGLIMLFGVCIYDLMGQYHILGTSKVGEDVFYQSLKSVRTGIVIGTLTTLIMLPFAILFGIMAGYFRGIIDDIIQYVYTTLSSIPGVLLIAAAVLTLQVMIGRHEEWFTTMAHRSDARLLALCAILGVTSWTGLCRLLRGEALKLREMEYVQASRALGCGHFRIIFKHLLPNVMHIILISVALDFSGLVLAEAVLSYVGVGVDPTTYSWGTMINGARLEMARVPVVWWGLSAAFMFMFALVLAANVFADALRDAFDPRSQTAGAK